ncbi:MAG: T9SS type A sorting domain-containing protein [Lewinellaceae bacterium]|nr:T9SS type A sorting domain-containing protein [Saprospiraceae bacterium]MCB9331861.1 T9SS type A sorting domain-containing protein [Lewinellaceae bacterium]
MKAIPLFLTAFLLLAISQHLDAQTYVNASATGNNDGTSWANAYTTLHDALENYNAGDEIWVAAGTYLPQLPSAWPLTIYPRNIFYLYQDVKLYGGFDGTETMLAERDPAVNMTILSGDLNGDDIPGDFIANKSDNAINVLLLTDAISPATVIDGFTIMGGHADETLALPYNHWGGGIWSAGSPTIRNCRFTQNYARQEGGGLYLRDGTAAGTVVEDCTFEANYSKVRGGGMVVSTKEASAEVQVNNCQFLENTAENSGGGFYSNQSSVAFSNCQFAGNSCKNSGGGMYFNNETGSDLKIGFTDCSFKNNTANHGGGYYHTSNGLGNDDITFSNCSFTGNAAIDSTGFFNPNGGALGFYYNGDNPSRDSIQIVACTFSGNTAKLLGGSIAFFNDFGTSNYLNINNCRFSDNLSDRTGGGVFFGNYGSTGMQAILSDCVFNNNTAKYGGAFWYFTNSGHDNHLSFVSNEFTENKAIGVDSVSSPYSGGLGFEYGANGPTNDTIQMKNCLIQGNVSERFVGGVYYFHDAGSGDHFQVDDCQFIDNESINGGGIGIIEGGTTFSALVRNSRFSGNTGLSMAFGIGGKLVPQDRHVELVNCLFTGHNANDLNSAVVGVSNDCLLTNCTFTDNASPLLGTNDTATISVRNTILHTNGFPSFYHFDSLQAGRVVSLGGNLVSDNAIDLWLNSTDQSGVDPLFESGSYQPAQNSPAVDAGVLLDNPEPTDLAGNSRVQGSCIDIGAYESPYDNGVQNCQTFTGAREALAGSSTALSVFPNPVTETANISIENDWYGALQLRIVNTLGQVVYTAAFEKFDRTAVVDFDAGSLPNGIYRVLVSNGAMVAVSGFIRL